MYLSLGVSLEASSVCLSKPCQNGGSCQEAPLEYLCPCPSPLPSPLRPECQEEHQPCLHLHGTCQGNTTCQPKYAGSQELSCRCEVGTAGQSCESRVQLCARVHCGVEEEEEEEEGAKCRLSPSPGAEQGYSCVCQPGFTGGQCETPMDQCAPNPCRNHAICRSRGDGPTCFCVPGFQGALCEIEVDECISQPCRNGATCVNKIGRYLCQCRPGFTGVSCELQIDECQSQPCLNGGRCHDYVNGFSCTCGAGFQGDRCEVDVDECMDQPCQHGARCIDGINSFSCDCSQTGFTGLRCEVPEPACWSAPCLHGAQCEDNGTDYTCKCWPGFEGPRCEVDVSECASGPCLNGGRCLERSWEALYGTEPDFPETFDLRHAAGYTCRCSPAHTGVLCEEDVNECDASPCQNGGVCENTVGSYTCVCPQLSPDGLHYGGQDCTVALVGCEGHECQNAAACLPFLSEGRHGYGCLCPAGFTGSRCQTSTTFSFERRGRLLLQTPLLDAEAASNITLSFRTVLPDAVLFQRGSGGPLLTLEVRQGRLRLSLHGGDTPLGALELSRNVTDGQWHGVQALLAEGLLSLTLLDAACESGGPDCEGSTQVDSGPPGSALQHTLIGGPEGPSFVGCLRDLFVDSQLMVPEDWLSSSAINVTPGCSHRDRCLDGPCENRGQCVNLWQAYQCRCQRPYQGQNCSEEYVTARFGHEDTQSYAVFSLDQEPAEPDALSVSLFVRTRRPSGLLLVLSNGTGQYLRVWLERGLAHVQLHQLEEVTGPAALDDGEVHLLSVSVEAGRLRLVQSGRGEGAVAAETRPVRVQAGDVVHVGGLEEPRGTATFGGYFKGCVQDLRLGTLLLHFFALELDHEPISSLLPQTTSHIVQGCVGDDTCATNPCQNGGMCYSVWDDFTCTCPPNTAGQQCEEVKWCELAPCPPEAVCRTIGRGYECLANMTFQGNTAITYRGSGGIESSLTSIAFSLRTRQRDAAILHAERGTEFITVWLQDGLLVLQLLSGNTSSSSSSPSSSASPVVPVNDGAWHRAEFFMVAPWAEASPWTLLLDEREELSSSSGSARAGGLDFARDGVDVQLGGLGPEAGGWGLRGCLGPVELGGVPLPYYGPDEVTLPRLQPERFHLRGLAGAVPIAGCRGQAVCQPEGAACLNGGRCRDLFDEFACECAPGWAGRRCQLNEDTCASAPCGHGNCTVVGLEYRCVCQVGYTGADCSTEVDVCQGHACVNGATCLHGVNKYACLCAENYTGSYCEERIEEVPWYIAVHNKKRPKLPVSICGDELRNYTCFNGGNCSELELSCDCRPGFTGHRCELELDECKSNPCLNGGYCRNLVNRFQCVCEMSFGGERCQVDLSVEGLSSDLLLSAGLLAVALLVALSASVTALVVALNRRATRGTYSPSRQEKEGSRVELWSIVQPPPTERLI
ncbi:protein crumbs homolog 1 [Sardina pilchardus]|uniref:protein crumbs homolog 1 n=1 Tax=Sardina pilchardus TaxID=27697 RepID=UPI002E137CD4